MSTEQKGNVLKNGWWFCGIKSFYCCCQSEEEAGSAGEQPVSNKIGAITIDERGCFLQPLSYLSGSSMA